MNLAKHSVKNGLAAAALLVACYAQPSYAGYKSALSTQGVGSVGASLAYIATTNQALTPDNFTRPSAGVTTLGTWTAKVAQPPGTPTVCTSTVSTVFLTGGYKAVARSWVTTGVTSDDPDLSKKLADEKFTLTPNLCGAGYQIASGDETIDGQRFLVVLGQATDGTAAWFRGYFFNGTPASRDDLIQNGTKLYEALVKGPFDFGDVDSADRCKALRIPINYTGPDLYLVSDGVAVSMTDLQISCLNGTVALSACNPSYPSLTTSGGCGAVSIAYDPPASSIAPGTTAATVTATATDAAGNVTNCQFTVSRPALQFVNCPGSTVALTACSPVYPTLQTSGGCAPVSITFNPPSASSIPPGTAAATVTATARDANNSVATCQFTVSRPALQIVGCPGSTVALAACSPVYPTLQTSGGCAPVTITFNPPSASSIAPGTVAATVTATATDANNSVATCQFTVSRPALQIVCCPTAPVTIACGSTVTYPALTTSGGCAPVSITFDKAANTLPPGSSLVTATATDGNGSVATCAFTVNRPFLTLGSSGFASPIGGIGGSCTAPLRRVKGAGNNLPIKFSTYLCNTCVSSTTPPTVTITKLDSSCNPSLVEINQQQLALTSNQWHWQWQTLPTDVGFFRISVNLGDGNPNPPSAVVQLTP